MPYTLIECNLVPHCWCRRSKMGLGLVGNQRKATVPEITTSDNQSMQTSICECITTTTAIQNVQITRGKWQANDDPHVAVCIVLILQTTVFLLCKTELCVLGRARFDTVLEKTIISYLFSESSLCFGHKNTTKRTWRCDLNILFIAICITLRVSGNVSSVTWPT